MTRIYGDRMVTVGHPRRPYSRKVSIFWMLPMLLALAFLTLIFLKSWQDAQNGTIPSIRVSTQAAPWTAPGQNGQ